MRQRSLARIGAVRRTLGRLRALATALLVFAVGCKLDLDYRGADFCDGPDCDVGAGGDDAGPGDNGDDPDAAPEVVCDVLLTEPFDGGPTHIWDFTLISGGNQTSTSETLQLSAADDDSIALARLQQSFAPVGLRVTVRFGSQRIGAIARLIEVGEEDWVDFELSDGNVTMTKVDNGNVSALQRGFGGDGVRFTITDDLVVYELDSGSGFEEEQSLGSGFLLEDLKVELGVAADPIDPIVAEFDKVLVERCPTDGGGGGP